MPVTNDLLLIFEPDSESKRVLRGVADRLGCDHVETDSPQGLHDVLSMRRPNLAVLSIDSVTGDGLSALQILEQHDLRPRTLLVGSIGHRLLASVRRAAEARGMSVLGVVSRPLDAIAVEGVLSPHLSVMQPIPLHEIERAMVDNEFTLHFQPQVNIQFDAPQIQGVEALVRWSHPRRGLLQPRHFLPAIEEYGLASRLTDFVLAEAVRQAGIWRTNGMNLDMIVNLSPRLVRDRAFPERLAVLLRENAFPPKQLVLDVTESPLDEDRDLVLDVFTSLRILGVGLALDNFGTGFSSLTELYRMPFSEIKVDQTLISDVARERDAQLIVKAITNLAQTLQLTVCAEGIETRQMLDFAKSASFDSAQGRFFSEAVVASEVELMVRTWPSIGPAATGRWRAIQSAHPAALDPLTRFYAAKRKSLK